MARLALLFTGNRAAHLKARYPHSSHQQAFLHPEMPESERINCEEQQLKIIARAITQGIADLHAQMTALCGKSVNFVLEVSAEGGKLFVALSSATLGGKFVFLGESYSLKQDPLHSSRYS